MPAMVPAPQPVAADGPGQLAGVLLEYYVDGSIDLDEPEVDAVEGFAVDFTLTPLIVGFTP